MSGNNGRPDGPSMFILPETDDITLCLALTGVVTREDHQRCLVVPMRARIEKHGYFNLVQHFLPDFRGYTPDAADSSFQSIKDMGKFARRLAYVNPTARKLFQNNITRAMLGGEVRHFENDELAEAIAWAKGGESAE
jgi:hypothetical protein